MPIDCLKYRMHISLVLESNINSLRKHNEKEISITPMFHQINYTYVYIKMFFFGSK